MPKRLSDEVYITLTPNGVHQYGRQIGLWDSPYFMSPFTTETKFFFQGNDLRFTCHCDKYGRWTASKRIGGKLYKKRIKERENFLLKEFLGVEQYFLFKKKNKNPSIESPEVMIQILKERICELEAERDLLRSCLRIETGDDVSKNAYHHRNTAVELEEL